MVDVTMNRKSRTQNIYFGFPVGFSDQVLFAQANMPKRNKPKRPKGPGVSYSIAARIAADNKVIFNCVV